MNNDLLFILNTIMNSRRFKGGWVVDSDLLCIATCRIIDCNVDEYDNCLLGYRNNQKYPRLLITRWIDEQ